MYSKGHMIVTHTLSAMLTMIERQNTTESTKNVMKHKPN